MPYYICECERPKEVKRKDWEAQRPKETTPEEWFKQKPSNMTVAEWETARPKGETVEEWMPKRPTGATDAEWNARVKTHPGLNGDARICSQCGVSVDAHLDEKPLSRRACTT